MTAIIDTPDTLSSSQLARLKANGVTAVIRYDDRFSSGDWKQVHTTEVRAIAAAGLSLGIVYEDAGATASTFSDSTGYLAASYSRHMAPSRGQGDGSAIYFAVDFDPTISQINNLIRPYFRGVYRAFAEANGLPQLRAGAYCSGMCADALRGDHPDILIWITCSLGFAGSRDWVNGNKYDLWQNKCDTSYAGVNCDTNVARTPDWGWFVPWGTVPPPSPPPPPVHDVAWMQAKLNALGANPPLQVDGNAGPLTIAAMIAYLSQLENPTA